MQPADDITSVDHILIVSLVAASVIVLLIITVVLVVKRKHLKQWVRKGNYFACYMITRYFLTFMGHIIISS